VYFCIIILIGLVYSIHDPTEVAIQKMIEAGQEMIRMNGQGEEPGGLNHALKRDLELEIKNSSKCT
jgi:hypothetical protein